MLAVAATAQNQEYQRKYKLENADKLSIPEDSPVVLKSFALEAKSVYQSKDLYLDTPELLLFKNRMSLRFRKVEREGGEADYKLQLKDEMKSATDSRLEVEDEDLENYKIRTDAGMRPLTEILDRVFEKLGAENPSRNALAEIDELRFLTEWIKQQSDGFIVPFQVLTDLRRPELSSEVLSTIRPTVFVQGTRNRITVYTNPTSELHSVLKSRAINPEEEWRQERIQVAECSLDAVVSSSIFKSQKATLVIKELEIEDKLEQPDREVMEKLETELNAFLGEQLVPFLNSKYSQSVQALFGEK